MGRVAFMDNLDTWEDGSVISERLAERLKTHTTEVKVVQFRFDQDVSNLVKVGDSVDLDSILCLIQDPEVADLVDGEDASIATLKKLSSAAPRANTVGVVSKIECYYHGDLEDMRESTAKLVNEFDRQRMAKDRTLGITPSTGQDDGSLRIKSNMLEPFNVALKIYIDETLNCGTGDKLVFFNQMKSVISKVMTGENYCEDLTPLDIQMAKAATDARQVLSPTINATTSLLLRKLTEHVVKLHKGETDARA